jgi:hypothetical protein
MTFQTRSIFRPFAAASAALVLASLAGAQVANPEVEPNDTKAQATPAASGGAGMASGDFITGETTGASTSIAGAASADYFRVKTVAAPLGIYRHQLALTSDTLFQTGTLRGLNQTGSSATGGLIGSVDAVFQTAPTATRTVQWYGFGKGEEIFYRVTGTASTSAGYTATLSTDAVSPLIVADTIVSGAVRFGPAAGNTADIDYWLYDANLDPVPGAGRDDGTPLGVATFNLAPGVYTLAISNFNAGNNLASPPGESFFGNVLDFPGAFACSSTTTGVNCNVDITSDEGTVTTFDAFKQSAFDVVFIQFTVTQNNLLTGSGMVSPNSIPNDGTVPAQFVVTAQPGANPASTGIAVTADLSQIGGSATQQLFDDGLNGDGAAGDNVFGFAYTVTNGIAGGQFVLPFTVTDAQSRTFNGNFNNLVVVGPPAIVEDLGDLSLPVTLNRSVDLAAGETKWFRFSLSTAADAGLGTFLDLDTEGSAPTDTELGVYRLDGSLRVSDDDDGDGLRTQISFGLGGRPAVGTGVAYNGRDGTLDVGVYFLAVNQFNAVYGGAFQVTSSGAGAAGVQVNARSVTSPIPPAGTGVAAPNTLGNDGTFSTTLRVTVTPGSFPTSTNLAVVVDAANIGAGSVTLLDDGVAPDLVAGDNIFSGTALVADGTGEGPTALGFTITDGEMRSATGNINVTIFTPRGACCSTEGCDIKTRAQCTAQGGTYLGNDTTCSTGDGYVIQDGGAAFEDIAATGTLLTNVGDDATTPVTLSFPFTFFGQVYTDCVVSTNGNLQFTGSNSAAFTNGTIPSAAVPNNALYVLWDDYNFNINTVDDGLYTETRGTMGVDLRQIFQWTNVSQFGLAAPGDRNTFQLVLFEDGRVEYRYLEITPQGVAGDYTIGVENADGTLASSIPGTDVSSGSSKRVFFQPGQSNCTPPVQCARDYNGVEGVNGDDLADYIVDFFDSIANRESNLPGGSIPIPGGFAGSSTLDFTGFGRACPNAVDVPQPNPWNAPVDAYRTNGFKVGVGQNNAACEVPNGDDLADYIVIFFNGCP